MTIDELDEHDFVCDNKCNKGANVNLKFSVDYHYF